MCCFAWRAVIRPAVAYGFCGDLIDSIEGLAETRLSREAAEDAHEFGRAAHNDARLVSGYVRRAVPRMCSSGGSSAAGLKRNRLHDSISNPLRSMADPVSRLRWSLPLT